MDTLGQATTIGSGIVLIFAALVGGWFKYGRPQWRRVRTFFGRLDETINGRDATRDSYGRELAPAVPALADQQIAVQKQISELTGVVRELVSHREEIETVKAVQAEHAKAIAVNAANIADLKANVFERIAGHIDSAAAWRAVEVVAKQDNPEETP